MEGGSEVMINFEEIKFRGMSDNGTWIYGYYRCQKFNTRFSHERVLNQTIQDESHTITIGCEEFSVDKNSIGQRTGLKDVNGKEVYSGDILKKHYGSSNQYVIVAYDVERAAFINNDGFNELLFHVALNKCEIVGNIFETPELIK